MIPVNLAGKPLTGREHQVLQAIAQGWADKKTARLWGIAEVTVKNHALVVVRKLGAGNRPHAVALAYQRGLLPTEHPKAVAS